MSEGWNIAVLGATGAVGEALLETLAERQFPVGEIYALARNESAGEQLRFGGKTITVQDAAEFDWTQAQLAFFVAGKEATAAWVEEATNSGCLVIDSSGLFALEPDVPLVVPEVNPLVLTDYRNRNVIAVPDSLTSQLLAALKPLIDQGGLSRISVTSLISASAQGKKAVDALAGQSAKLLNGIPIDEEDFFGRQLAFNMLPLLPDSEGSVREERRIVDEVRKILQDEGLMISASVVQAPVFYGHAQMVNFEALRPLAAEEARDAFAQGEDIVLSEENEFPTQVGDASGTPHLSVGCVRNDYGMPEQVQFWSVADNVRFGGALMAVKIAEKLVQEYLYYCPTSNNRQFIKLRWALSTTAVSITAGNGRTKSAVCRRSWKRRSPRWRTNPSPSSAPGVLTQVYTAPGRLCISKRPRSAKTLRGRWA